MTHTHGGVAECLSEVIDRVNFARGGCDRLIELLAPTCAEGYAHANVSEAVGLLERVKRLLHAAWLEQSQGIGPTSAVCAQGLAHCAVLSKQLSHQPQQGPVVPPCKQCGASKWMWGRIAGDAVDTPRCGGCGVLLDTICNLCGQRASKHLGLGHEFYDLHGIKP